MKKYFYNFLSGEIDADTFWDLFNEDKKERQSKYQPWETKEWKERRAKILKDACECCGSTENLMIQHGWKPESYKELWNKSKILIESQGHHYSSMKNTELVHVDSPSCPRCHSSSIRKLKSGKFKCCNSKLKIVTEFFKDRSLPNVTKIIKVGEEGPSFSHETPEKFIFLRKEKCNKEFDTPIMIHRLENMTEFGKRKKKINEEITKLIKHDATKEWVTQTIDYHNLKNVKTYCKNCAFLEDKKLGFIPEDK